MSDEEFPEEEEQQSEENEEPAEPEILRPSRDEMLYKCINRDCKAEMSIADIESLQGIKCPYCGGRILVKIRPQTANRVKCD